MAQDLSALYNLLDRQIKQGESERAVNRFVCTLERKYEKRKHLFVAWSVITTWVLKKNWEML